MNTDDLINNLTNDTKAVNLAPRPFVILLTWLLAAASYIAVFLYITGFRSDISTKILEPIFIVDILLSIIIIMFAAVAASLSTYPDLSRKNTCTRITLLGVVALLLLMVWQSLNIPSTVPQPAMNHFSCASFMCLFGALPAALLFLLFSRGLCFTPSKTAILAGIASFMTGYLTLRLEEAQDTPMHLWTYHLAPLVLMIFITYLLGKTFLQAKLSK